MSTRRRILLACSSGLLLALSYPPVPGGVLALVGFVPLFLLLSDMEEYGRVFRYAYLTFFVLNALTLYWTGGFTHGRDWYLMMAGFLLLVAHPLFFTVPVLGSLFLRRQFGFKVSLLAFPFLWVGTEYVHSIGDVAFPWLTLGNTQSYDLAVIQIVSVTGVWGLSFWIVSVNVMAFFLLASLAAGRWRTFSKQSLGAGLAVLIVALLPKLYGLAVLVQDTGSRPTEEQKSVRLALVQPNIDPFEKWLSSLEKQLSVLQGQTGEIARASADLVIWPETAVPVYVLHPANRNILNKIREQVSAIAMPLYTGMPDMITYTDPATAPRSSKEDAEGTRYDTFNSSMLITPWSSEVQKYAKVLLVPFAERVPFSEQLSFLNAMEWNFGLGGWAHGGDTAVLTLDLPRHSPGASTRFSGMICYESAYPGFVAACVRKGAEFLVVITNDSWWGNTSGAYQHQRFAVLRAVENRRWIVQCANGGISCFIDPYGHTVSSTAMYEKTTLQGTVVPLHGTTFYTATGDWCGEGCIVLSLFLFAAGLGNIFVGAQRRRASDPVPGDMPGNEP